MHYVSDREKETGFGDALESDEMRVLVGGYVAGAAEQTACVGEGEGEGGPGGPPP